MKPIILTEFGETLNPYSGLDKVGTTEETVLISSRWGIRIYDKDVVGIHSACDGKIQLRKVSETHSALCCDQCNLRIVIPKEVDTYKKLRQWSTAAINLKQQRAEEVQQVVAEHAVYGECPSPEEIGQEEEFKEAAIELAESVARDGAK
jgi:hypothetical protein